MPPQKVPREYAGRWIAWDHSLTRIVASGRNYADARAAAEATGEQKPFLTKAPEFSVRFAGAHR